MNFSVYPTLFIGIGSTGADILNRLRKYCYEEFGSAGLPCFRYLAFETDEGNKFNDNFLPHEAAEYEKIKMVHITIPQVDVIKSRLVPGRQNYLKGVDEWLDQNLLNGNYKAFSTGAGFRRQAGRLCLWENWANKVKPTLREAHDALMAKDLGVRTNAFLKKHYLPKKFGKGNANLESADLFEDVPRFFITGTLCGGTGSGIFIDLAYYLLQRFLTGRQIQADQNRQAQIIGLFTIPSLIGLHDEGAKPNVVNTWTALRELDFFSRGSIYNVTLPDGDEIQTPNAPFDMVYLVGMNNLSGKSFGRDFDGLSDMCALSLFAEMVPAIAAPKAKIRINFRAAKAGYMEENDDHFIRAFSSFGLSAIWYPRYRIVKAVTFALGQKLAGYCVGTGEIDRNKVEEQLAKDWAQLRTEAEGRLFGTVHESGKNITDTISKLFQERQGEFVSLEEGLLKDFIAEFPAPDKTLADTFSNPDGEHYRRIANAASNVAEWLSQSVRRDLSDYLRTHSLMEALHYMERLRATVDNVMESLPASLTTFSPLEIESVDLEFANQLSEDMPTRILGLRQKAAEEYKEHVWMRFFEHANAHAERIRDYFLRQVLRSAAHDIRRLADSIGTIKNDLESFGRICASKRKEHVDYRASVNVFPISKGDPEKLEDDVEMALSQIDARLAASEMKARLIGQRDPLIILSSSVDELLLLVEREFDREAQEEATKFQIGSGTLDSFKSRLGQIVRASAPYVETIDEFKSMTLAMAQSPNLLFCHEEVAGKNLANTGSTLMPGTKAFEFEESPLDHFVIFYREEPGLALSDLAIRHPAERILAEYESQSRKNNDVTAFTHKMGEKHFDVNAENNYRDARNLVEVSLMIAPEIFTRENGNHYLEYQAENGFSRSFSVTDAKSLRDFLNENGLPRFVDMSHRKLKNLGLEAFRERVNAKVRSMANGPDREQVQKRLEALARELFSTGDVSPEAAARNS